MTDLLVTIPLSHYCEKARWALDRSGLPYREEGHLPLLHWAATYPRGARRTVPVLVLDEEPDARDGQRVLSDSTDILQYADSRAPAALRLYPDDAEQRREVEQLEDLFDEKLGPAVRRWGYFHLLPDKALALATVGTGVPGWQRSLGALGYGLFARLLRRGLNVTAEAAERSRLRTRGLFDEVSARLADGRRYLVGDQFSAADLTFAALTGPALLPTEYGVGLPALERVPAAMRQEVEYLRATPAGQYALRLYQTERRRR